MFPLKVLQEAKKHKKLFEKYWVHPFYLHLNSTDFYLVFFTRFYSKKSELIVSATTNEADQADYNRALEYLVFLLNNGASIVDNGNSRKKN
ncbi:hypothetical protein [Piscibacillus salipiscarius]|uniref:Uncharacterized protein n=1 Tax=Piscibacillus salipiscarius TaxID=299480 RepID=A0ABW5QA10_9BACI